MPAGRTINSRCCGETGSIEVRPETDRSADAQKRLSLTMDARRPDSL